MSRIHIGLTLACALSLAACGGGESPKDMPVEPVVPKSRDIVVSTNSFDVAVPYKAMIDPEAYVQYDVHGGCAGTADAQKTAVVAASLKIGVLLSDLVTSLFSQFSYTVNNKLLDTQYACDTGEPEMLTYHFDSNREWIGVQETGTWHAIYDDRANSYRALPATVKATDSGTLRIFNIYSWDSLVNQTGRIVWSYETNPVAANTVEFVLKTRYQECVGASACAAAADSRVEKMHYVLGNGKMLFWKRVVTNNSKNVSVTYCERGVDCTKPLVDQIDLFASQLN